MGTEQERHKGQTTGVESLVLPFSELCQWIVVGNPPTPIPPNPGLTSRQANSFNGREHSTPRGVPFPRCEDSAANTGGQGRTETFLPVQSCLLWGEEQKLPVRRGRAFKTPVPPRDRIRALMKPPDVLCPGASPWLAFVSSQERG